MVDGCGLVTNFNGVASNPAPPLMSFPYTLFRIVQEHEIGTTLYFDAFYARGQFLDPNAFMIYNSYEEDWANSKKRLGYAYVNGVQVDLPWGRRYWEHETYQHESNIPNLATGYELPTYNIWTNYPNNFQVNASYNNSGWISFSAEPL